VPTTARVSSASFQFHDELFKLAQRIAEIVPLQTSGALVVSRLTGPLDIYLRFSLDLPGMLQEKWLTWQVPRLKPSRFFAAGPRARHSIEAPNRPMGVPALLQTRRQRRQILRQNLHQGVHRNLLRGLQLFSQRRVQLSAHNPMDEMLSRSSDFLPRPCAVTNGVSLPAPGVDPALPTTVKIREAGVDTRDTGKLHKAQGRGRSPTLGFNE